MPTQTLHPDKIGRRNPRKGRTGETSVGVTTLALGRQIDVASVEPHRLPHGGTVDQASSCGKVEARRRRYCAPSGARVGEVKRITPNSLSSRSIGRLHMKHETATLAHDLNLVPNDISHWRSTIPVRSTARTSGFLARMSAYCIMAKHAICLSKIVKNEARFSPAFLRLDRTKLFGSVLTGRWRGMPVSSLAPFLALQIMGCASRPLRTLHSATAYDHDLLAASSVTSRTMPARKKSFDKHGLR